MLEPELLAEYRQQLELVDGARGNEDLPEPATGALLLDECRLGLRRRDQSEFDQLLADALAAGIEALVVARLLMRR